MYTKQMRILTIVSAVLALTMSVSVCVADGFGCSSCGATAVAAPAYTTYMAPTYTTYMAPTYAYMPTPVYRATYRPVYATAYQPVYQSVGGCSTCASYAQTTYRPVFGGWSYTARMVPYVTYQPDYTTPVASVAYYGCSTCPTCTSECSSCSSCSSGSCGTVSYGAPSSGCASCAAQTTVVSPAPASNNGQATPPKTFEEKTQKPVAEPEVKPVPQTEMKFNSMPSPLLPDPRDRTATGSARAAVRVALIAAPIQTAPVVQDNDGWQPARD
jgi:hypothetical protein